MVGRDLLGRVAVDDVVVARAHRLVEQEADLVLAEVALALGALDDRAGGVHLVADLAQQRLDAVAPEDGVVDVVAVRRREARVARVPGLLVGLLEDDELELGAAVRNHPEAGRPVHLRLEHRPRRLLDRAAPVEPGEVALHGGRVPAARGAAQRVEVEVEEHVAVAALPRGDRVAVDGVHVDVDGEQVVAALRAVLEDVVEEVVAVQPLALQATLHVGERDDDGVDVARLDLRAQLVDGQGWWFRHVLFLSDEATQQRGGGVAVLLHHRPAPGPRRRRGWRRRPARAGRRSARCCAAAPGWP